MDDRIVEFWAERVKYHGGDLLLGAIDTIEHFNLVGEGSLRFQALGLALFEEAVRRIGHAGPVPPQ